MNHEFYQPFLRQLQLGLILNFTRIFSIICFRKSTKKSIRNTSRLPPYKLHKGFSKNPFIRCVKVESWDIFKTSPGFLSEILSEQPKFSHEIPSEIPPEIFLCIHWRFLPQSLVRILVVNSPMIFQSYIQELHLRFLLSKFLP